MVGGKVDAGKTLYGCCGRKGESAASCQPNGGPTFQLHTVPFRRNSRRGVLGSGRFREASSSSEASESAGRRLLLPPHTSPLYISVAHLVNPTTCHW